MSNNSFKIKNSAVLTPKDLSTLVSPEAGEIACDINDSNKIKRYDAASSSWVEVGSGGVGSVDIMFVQDFESSSLSSFTQTGLSLSTTNPLHGKVSALLTHQAAVNQSFKQVVAVDPKFRGQGMVLDLNIKSAASAGNVVIKVTDESNSADLISSEALQLSNDVSGRRSSVSFTIPSTCSSLSYTITALPEAGSPVTRIDDIVSYLSDVALLETSVEVPNVTSWTSYTPTFQGFGTPSNVQFEYRQVGENVEIRGKFTSGTSTAVEARIGLPAGLTSAGTSLIPSLQVAGKAALSVISAADYVMLAEPSVAHLTIGRQASTVAGLSKINGNALSSGDSLSFFASVPCAGLSATTTKTIPLTQSGLVQNADGNLQINGFTPANGSTNTCIMTIASGTIAKNIGDHVVWIPSATLGDTFTVTKSGVYSFNFSSDTGINGKSIGFSKNSTQLTTGITAINASDKLNVGIDTGNSSSSTVSWTGSLVAGDIIRIHNDTGTFSGTTAGYSTFSCSYQGSLKQISVSSDQKITIPTSELRFEGASSRGSTATAIVKFDTMAKLRGDAFTVESDSVLGTRITMKKAGKLDANVSIYSTVSGNTYVISKNQSNLSALAVTSEVMAVTYANSLHQTNAACSIFVNVGDIIRVSSNNSPIADSRNVLNLSFQEQDIAVSVTNTLPQFSDSDSSVRVDTANGYGSTANKIRRFSNVRDNLGSDIEYLDSATNGASFTVRTSGIYNISYTEQATGAAYFGISKNSSQLTTNIGSINTVDRLCMGTTDTTSGYPETVSWQGYLNAGDIIRAHNEGSPSNVATDRTQFTISKVGKPNVTGVDVTPFVNVPQPDIASYSVINSPNGFGSTYTQTPRFLSIQQNDGKGILSYTDSPTLGAYWTANKKCIATITLNSIYLAAAAWSFRIFKNQTGVTTGTGLTTIDDQANTRAGGTISVELNVGDRISFYYSSTSMNRTEEHVFITATALSDQILTAPETFSTDTASLQYASSSLYNLTTLANAPVGTYITFTYAANTNTRTQTTTPPSQSPADMNANGILLYTRALNAASTAAQPAAVAIQIGKGLKGRTLDLYASAGKVLAGNLDFYYAGGASNSVVGVYIRDYNESTGILLIDAGFTPIASNTSHNLGFSDQSSQTSGYLVINASKSPALTGVPLLQPRIATLSDVKASGTAGGSSTAGAYQTRTLNTLSDPSGVVTSLASNQFTLQAGTYYIEATAPCSASSPNKIKIRNITDSSDEILGSAVGNGSTGSAFTVSTQSRLAGTITISANKTFELQHRVVSSRTTDGYGTPCSFGDNEVYSIVTVTKVK